VKGGTLVPFSPTYHSFAKVLLPLLENMGVHADYQLISHGFIPDIVGSVKVTI